MNLPSRFSGRSRPSWRGIPSQYLDSSQIGINVTATIAVSPSNFLPGGWNNVLVSGASTVYTSFKPEHYVLTESVVATFVNPSGTTYVAYDDIRAHDLILVGGFSGALNTFPNAPSAASGIHGHAIGPRSTVLEVSWPTVNEGIPVTANFLVLQSVLWRVPPPPGYAATQLVSLTVGAFFSMFGPELR